MLKKAGIWIAVIGIIIVGIILLPKVDIVSTKNVQVTIVDAYRMEEERYQQTYYPPYGKIILPSNYTYYVEVEYGGMTFSIENKGYYEKYRKNIGNTVMAVLKITTYNNGRVEYSIIKLF